jgi:protein-tyrosine phosphatase
VEQIDDNKIVCVYGNVHGLGGNSRQPQKMELVLKKDPISKQLALFSQIIFNIRATRRFIRYRYLIYDIKEGRAFWEREPDRVCDLQLLQANVASSWPLDCNKKEWILFQEKQSSYKKIDINFGANFHFKKINENIFIGPYPQNRQEAEFLATVGIGAVLNLQTDVDLTNRSVKWGEMINYYNGRNIIAARSPLSEQGDQEIVEKAFAIATTLHELIHRHNIVYLHCTGGIKRAPLIVMCYLHFYENMPLEDAADLIRQKRPIACMRMSVAQECVKHAISCGFWLPPPHPPALITKKKSGETHGIGSPKRTETTSTATLNHVNNGGSQDNFSLYGPNLGGPGCDEELKDNADTITPPNEPCHPTILEKIGSQEANLTSTTLKGNPGDEFKHENEETALFEFCPD